MNRTTATLILAIAFVLCAILSVGSATAATESSAVARVKRGHGGGGGHGHGPGRGGGAAGPIYFCGYVGKTEGSGYGYGK